MAAEAAPEQQQAETEEYDFEGAFQRLAGAKCRVDRILLVGLERTKQDLVEAELRRLKDGRTLEEIRDAAMAAHDELMALDVFDAIDLVLTEGTKGANTCTVVARFREKGMLRLHAGTYVQGTEGSVQTSLNLTNPLGHAEQVSLSAEYGSQSTNLYTLAVTKPKPLGRPLLADVRLHQLGHNYQPWSSYAELLRGGQVTLSSEDGRHAVSYELGWRRLSDPGRTASRAVLGQLGDKLLSSVKYVHRGDTFDSLAFPTQGWGYRAETQVAGLGAPNPSLLRFVRQHLQGRAAFRLADGAALTLSAEAGLLLPWGAGGRAGGTPISDRFFLGGTGVGALRGFAQKGVGPSDARRPVAEASSGGSEAAHQLGRRDALGGDLFCSLMAAVNFQLPAESLRSAGIHGHVFVNGGSLVHGVAPGRSLQNAWHEFATSFRWSVGAGIVWPTKIGKLELNLCQVLARQPFDQPRVGLQFGFMPPAW